MQVIFNEQDYLELLRYLQDRDKYNALKKCHKLLQQFTLHIKGIPVWDNHSPSGLEVAKISESPEQLPSNSAFIFAKPESIEEILKEHDAAKNQGNKVGISAPYLDQQGYLSAGAYVVDTELNAQLLASFETNIGAKSRDQQIEDYTLTTNAGAAIHAFLPTLYEYLQSQALKSPSHKRLYALLEIYLELAAMQQPTPQGQTFEYSSDSVDKFFNKAQELIAQVVYDRVLTKQKIDVLLADLQGLLVQLEEHVTNIADEQTDIRPTLYDAVDAVTECSGKIISAEEKQEFKSRIQSNSEAIKHYARRSVFVSAFNNTFSKESPLTPLLDVCSTIQVYKDEINAILNANCTESCQVEGKHSKLKHCFTELLQYLNAHLQNAKLNDQPEIARLKTNIVSLANQVSEQVEDDGYKAVYDNMFGQVLDNIPLKPSNHQPLLVKNVIQPSKIQRLLEQRLKEYKISCQLKKKAGKFLFEEVHVRSLTTVPSNLKKRTLSVSKKGANIAETFRAVQQDICSANEWDTDNFFKFLSLNKGDIPESFELNAYTLYELQTGIGGRKHITPSGTADYDVFCNCLLAALNEAEAKDLLFLLNYGMTPISFINSVITRLSRASMEPEDIQEEIATVEHYTTAFVKTAEDMLKSDPARSVSNFVLTKERRSLEDIKQELNNLQRALELKYNQEIQKRKAVEWLDLTSMAKNLKQLEKMPTIKHSNQNGYTAILASARKNLTDLRDEALTPDVTVAQDTNAFLWQRAIHISKDMGNKLSQIKALKKTLREAKINKFQVSKPAFKGFWPVPLIRFIRDLWIYKRQSRAWKQSAAYQDLKLLDTLAENLTTANTTLQHAIVKYIEINKDKQGIKSPTAESSVTSNNSYSIATELLGQPIKRSVPSSPVTEVFSSLYGSDNNSENHVPIPGVEGVIGNHIPGLRK